MKEVNLIELLNQLNSMKKSNNPETIFASALNQILGSASSQNSETANSARGKSHEQEPQKNRKSCCPKEEGLQSRTKCFDELEIGKKEQSLKGQQDKSSVKQNTSIYSIQTHLEEQKHTVDILIPGVNKEDLDLYLIDSGIKIIVKRQEDKTYSDLAFKSEEITIPLDVSSIDTKEIKATYNNGIFSIILKFKKEEPKTSIKIDIT